MKKRIWVITYVMLLLTLTWTPSAAGLSTSLVYNGIMLESDTAPLVKSGTTLVPIRVITEAMGATVAWNGVTRTATVIKDGKTVELTAGRWYGRVNGRDVPLNYPVTIVNSRILVPVRFVAENLDCIVRWQAVNQEVHIYYVGNRLLKYGDKGEDVRGLQVLLNDYGYGLIADGIFGDQTKQAVTAFQKNEGIAVDGIVGPMTKKALASFDVETNDNILTPSRAGTRYGDPMSWWEVTKIWKAGTVATITDLDTGMSYQVKRLGGTNHADVEPLTVKDTNTMRAIYGGEWSWARRAIIVTYGNYRWAASQNGMPHSVQTIYDNDFPGHFCIHFKDSMTHGSNQWAPSPAHVDDAHQAMVMKAAGLGN